MSVWRETFHVFRPLPIGVGIILAGSALVATVHFIFN